jgi:periplasmic divalent cation tolerance protein
VVAWIKARHGYDCPSILALPIEAGNQDYLDWIDRETAN